MNSRVEKEAVVLVHGLWVNGMDMSLLRYRLGRNYDTFQFSYNSVRHSPAENAQQLNLFASRIENKVVHFVGHSLGGLVIRHFFHLFPQQTPGRVVTLGSPHNQSHAARLLSQYAMTRMLLGRSLDGGLLGSVPEWQAERELGSIAGTLRFGMGMIIPGLPAPNDGTVSVRETELKGMRDHLILPVSHFGLVVSTRVCEATDCFLREGEFR